jgi:hypothetical protein
MPATDAARVPCDTCHGEGRVPNQGRCLDCHGIGSFPAPACPESPPCDDCEAALISESLVVLAAPEPAGRYEPGPAGTPLRTREVRVPTDDQDEAARRVMAALADDLGGMGPAS